MSEEKTAIRLSKATKELGVGIDHIIDFLSGKGIKVDKNPNTKITSDAFHLLVQEFQNDMQAKNDARDITTEKKNRENLVIEVKETS